MSQTRLDAVLSCLGTAGWSRSKACDQKTETEMCMRTEEPRAMATWRRKAGRAGTNGHNLIVTT